MGIERHPRVLRPSWVEWRAAEIVTDRFMPETGFFFSLFFFRYRENQGKITSARYDKLGTNNFSDGGFYRVKRREADLSGGENFTPSFTAGQPF